MAIIKLSKAEAELLYNILSNSIAEASEDDDAFENKNSEYNRLDRIQSKIYQGANLGGKQ